MEKMSPATEQRYSEYTTACIYAMCGKPGLALKFLKRALKKRQLTPATAWIDIDFESLWEDLRFIKLVGPRPEKPA